MSAHRGLVLHVQVGDGSCYGEFSVPANQASSHFWIGKDGTLEQYVDTDLMAWTEADGNASWLSVETEGVPTEALTAAQAATCARLYRALAGRYHFPFTTTDDPNGTGFGWHGMGGSAWGGHFGCPGELRKAQRPAILAFAALPILPGGPMPRNALPAGALPATCASAGWTPDGLQWNVIMNGADGRVYHIWWLPAPKTWNGPEDLTQTG